MANFKHLINQLGKIHLCSKHLSRNSSHLTKILDQKKQEFNLELDKLEKRIVDLEEYRRKADFYIKKSFKKVCNDVNKRRDEMDKIIQDHYLKLMEKIAKDRDEKKARFNQQIEQIDAFQIHVNKIDENLDTGAKIELLKDNLGDVRSKGKLVETAIADLTREDFSFTFPTDLSMNRVFGQVAENKHKKISVEVNNIFRDSALSENLSHKGDIIDLKLIDDTKLLSASKDGTVKMWDIETKTCIRKFSAFNHINSIACICELNDGLLATGYFDKKIKLWNLEKGECEMNIIAHSDQITCLTLLKSGFMISGSSDCTLKKWNQKSGECLAVFQGHSNSINCIDETEDEKILSGSSDCQIRVWNQAAKCLRVLNGHQDFVLCIKVLKNGRIASGSKDKTIKIWNVETGINERTLTGHMEPISCLLPLKNDKLMSGSWDGTIKIWDLTSGNSIKTIKVHQDKINCIQVDSNENIFTCSSDKTIKLLNLYDFNK
ncbi:F-box WD repeat-containing 7 [Brachionus plicatilis]|uniref:F-box WD repeat-containing 7 n=1 Tax=Brachionus plicatilis TaxID=10195 RepID=A0A3M7S7X9_BRAPC|nr:F-box WD repeat-containing 7 [Brachionus plicatilis]